MRRLWLKYDFDEAALKLKGKPPDPSNVLQTIDENTRAISIRDGKTVALFLRNAIPTDIQRRAYKDYKIVNDLPGNRVDAVGTIPLPRHRRRDGTWSPRWGVNEAVLRVLKERGVGYGILGYLARPYRKTRLTREKPELLNRNRILVDLVDDLYRKHLPAERVSQVAVLERFPHYRLWTTAFSSIYLAKNWQTNFHRDGNLRGARTVIMAMGRFTGGALVIARWRIGFALQPGDLLIFDAEELHGNLPFEGERLSAAFFCTRGICNCG